jgi:hypothetical protein
MGGSAPADSKATGTISTTTGSQSETGTITILTRGTNQSLDQVSTPNGGTVVYSKGVAGTVHDSSTSLFSAELALTAQSASFPLPLLAGLLGNPDSSSTFIGQETVQGVSAYHIQVTSTMASTPRLASLAKYSQRDIWIDASSKLVLRIAYKDHANQTSPAVPVQLDFSDYSSISGVLYPHSIQKAINGTPWAQISITDVVINAGLTDSDFPVN